MKLVIIIAITFVLLIPINVFGYSSDVQRQVAEAMNADTYHDVGALILRIKIW